MRALDTVGDPHFELRETDRVADEEQRIIDNLQQQVEERINRGEISVSEFTLNRGESGETMALSNFWINERILDYWTKLTKKNDLRNL